MPIISTVGLFCCDKFEETPNEKVSDLSKLTKPQFDGKVTFGFIEFVLIQFYSVYCVLFL